MGDSSFLLFSLHIFTLFELYCYLEIGYNAINNILTIIKNSAFSLHSNIIVLFPFNNNYGAG